MSDHGSRGWEATATGWRCTECHGEVVGPVDVHIDDAHVCTPPPTREPIRLTDEERASIAEVVYDAYRLGKGGKQEYLPMWHELDHQQEPNSIETRRMHELVESILAARSAGKDEEL